MTKAIDTDELRALAAAADAQPYNVIVTGDYGFAMNKLKSRPEQVVALLDRLAAAEARNATLTDDAARWQYAMDWGNKTFAVCMRLPGEDWDPINTNGPIDHAMAEARAAASISTKGDGHV